MNDTLNEVNDDTLTVFGDVIVDTRVDIERCLLDTFVCTDVTVVSVHSKVGLGLVLEVSGTVGEKEVSNTSVTADVPMVFGDLFISVTFVTDEDSFEEVFVTSEDLCVTVTSVTNDVFNLSVVKEVSVILGFSDVVTLSVNVEVGLEDKNIVLFVEVKEKCDIVVRLFVLSPVEISLTIVTSEELKGGEVPDVIVDGFVVTSLVADTLAVVGVSITLGCRHDIFSSVLGPSVRRENVNPYG